MHTGTTATLVAKVAARAADPKSLDPEERGVLQGIRTVQDLYDKGEAFETVLTYAMHEYGTYLGGALAAHCYPRDCATVRWAVSEMQHGHSRQEVWTQLTCDPQNFRSRAHVELVLDLAEERMRNTPR
jgi:hypothetical protein